MKFWSFIFIILICANEAQKMSESNQNKLQNNPYLTVTVTPKKQARPLQPQVYSIFVNQSQLYPITHKDKSQKICFSANSTRIYSGQQLTIRANSPFVIFLSAKSVNTNQQNQEYHVSANENIYLNYIVSSQNIQKTHIIKIPLIASFPQQLTRFYQMQGRIHIDFYQCQEQFDLEFSFIFMSGTRQQNAFYDALFRNLYIFCSLAISLIFRVERKQKYHTFHKILFVVFLIGSLITTQLLASIFTTLVFVHTVILQKLKKRCPLNRLTWFLLMSFYISILLTQIFATNDQKTLKLTTSQRFILNQLRICGATFIIVILVKLSRLRQVFWYFIVVANFSLFCQGKNNSIFDIEVENPFLFTQYKIDVFFPLMMIPINKYFSSIASWLYYLINLLIAISAVIPLAHSIRLMAVSFVVILAALIRAKSTKGIAHRC